MPGSILDADSQEILALLSRPPSQDKVAPVKRSRLGADLGSKLPLQTTVSGAPSSVAAEAHRQHKVFSACEFSVTNGVHLT